MSSFDVKVVEGKERRVVATWDALPETNNKLFRRLRAEGCLDETTRGRIMAIHASNVVTILDRYTGQPMAEIIQR